MAYLVFSSNSTISSFGKEDLINSIDELQNLIPNLPFIEYLNMVYSYLFNGIKELVDKLGIMGLLLASKSINFVLTSIKDSKRVMNIKEEINLLEEELSKGKEHNA